MSCCVRGPCPGGPRWTQVRTLASAASLLSTASVSTKKSLLWSHRFPGSVGICSGGIHVQRCSPARGPAKSPSTCFPVTLQPAVCGSCFSIFSPAFGRGRHFAFCRDGVSFLIAILTSISLIASEQGYLFICKHGYAIFPFFSLYCPISYHSVFFLLVGINCHIFFIRTHHCVLLSAPVHVQCLSSVYDGWGPAGILTFM